MSKQSSTPSSIALPSITGATSIHPLRSFACNDVRVFGFRPRPLSVLSATVEPGEGRRSIMHDERETSEMVYPSCTASGGRMTWRERSEMRCTAADVERLDSTGSAVCEAGVASRDGLDVLEVDGPA